MDGDAPVFTAVAQTSLEPKVIAKATSASELQKWVGDGPFSLCLPESEDQKSMFDDEPSGWMVAKGNEVREAAAEAVHGLFASGPDRAIGHDLKSLYKNIDPCLTPPRMDTMIAAYVLQSGRGTYEAGSIIQAYLDAELPLSPEQQALGLLLLEEPLREKVKAEGEEKVLYDVELPLVPLLAEMEQAGIATSADMLHEFSKSLEIDIERVRQTVWEYAGQEFNIGSPKQIGQILFEKLEIPGGKKTKTGWATGVEILSDLQADWEIAGEILTYRELTKLKSTYADSLPKMIASDGRIHTSFSQAVAATGRLSSSDPNLQNIPIRTELGRQIRRAFHAEEGNTLLSLDYSQIELRVLAHMCDDENLTEAFQSGTDVHTVTAALMFNIKSDEVTKEQRGMAKMLNYAVLYGVTGYGLSNQLGAEFNPASANELIEQYQERFPKIHGFMDTIVAGARSTGYTSTLIGRRRHFPDIHAANWNTRQYAERQAMNAPIQGTAADMIKIAMLDVRKLIEGSELAMLLQVHDELVFEGTPDVIQEWIEPIREAMEQALPLDVPVEVDAKVGENWLEMKPV
jgi:DNA polymerase-1